MSQHDWLRLRELERRVAELERLIQTKANKPHIRGTVGPYDAGRKV